MQSPLQMLQWVFILSYALCSLDPAAAVDNSFHCMRVAWHTRLIVRVNFELKATPPPPPKKNKKNV